MVVYLYEQGNNLNKIRSNEALKLNYLKLRIHHPQMINHYCQVH
jgi:hypothetical protein